MSESEALGQVHPQGEVEQACEDERTRAGETFGGKVGLRWDQEAVVTACGQWPYFVEFLKTSGLFEAWLKDCPLSYTSPNRAGDVARGGVGSDRAVVPRPRRRREQLRRAEEPVGLDGLHDARVEAQPGDGGRDCVDLRLVGAVHAVGGGRQGRSDHNAALAAARHCAAHAARAADDADDHEFARQSGPGCDGRWKRRAAFSSA